MGNRVALAQARRADTDLAAGIYKSPLQGIPYGIKDLFSVKGGPQFQHRKRREELEGPPLGRLSRGRD